MVTPDQWLAWCDAQRGDHAAYKNLEQRIAAALAERDAALAEARRALKKYGVHLPQCAADQCGAVQGQTWLPCTCGLDAALGRGSSLPFRAREIVEQVLAVVNRVGYFDGYMFRTDRKLVLNDLAVPGGLLPAKDHLTNLVAAALTKLIADALAERDAALAEGAPQEREGATRP